MVNILDGLGLEGSVLDGLEQLWLALAQLSSLLVQGCRCRPVEPVRLLCGGAGIAVVAGGDHNACKRSKEHQ